MIISVQEAHELTLKENVVFADCRYDLKDENWGKEMFHQGHIPNGVYFDLNKDLSGQVKNHGGRHPLPNIETFKTKLATKGIHRETTVIVYCQNRAFSSRMYWLLKFIGHPTVYLMNGGFEEWKQSGYPVSQSELNKTANQYGNSEIKEDLIADMYYVKENKDRDSVTLIDSRSYDRYIGKHEPIDRKAGHIPGAINSEWTNILNDQHQFKSQDELINYFSTYQDAEEMIVYCGSGVTATPNVVALWLAGFDNVRLYVGSFSDWISYDENEIAKE